MCLARSLFALYAAAAPAAPAVSVLQHDSGADKSLKNADEKTAFEVAELNEQEDVMALLK
jgi:hypothetical protein